MRLYPVAALAGVIDVRLSGLKGLKGSAGTGNCKAFRKSARVLRDVLSIEELRARRKLERQAKKRGRMYS